MARIRYNKVYYKSQQWLKIRELLIEWADHKCKKCGSGKNLQVHHKHYRTFGDEMPWDLIVLCKKCHEDVEYVNKPDSDWVLGEH